MSPTMTLEYIDIPHSQIRKVIFNVEFMLLILLSLYISIEEYGDNKTFKYRIGKNSASQLRRAARQGKDISA